MEELYQMLDDGASELNKDELLDRLKPFAQGCFDGVSEWPQLKPLLRDIYTYLDKSPQILRDVLVITIKDTYKMNYTQNLYIKEYLNLFEKSILPIITTISLPFFIITSITYKTTAYIFNTLTNNKI